MARWISNILFSLMLVVPLTAHAQDDKKRILVFGDSLTWGWVPTEPIVPTTRHALEDRWTSVMSDALGDEYRVLVDGLSGRTTNIDDPNDPKLNGADYLPSLLAANEPLDLVVILLGTNDTKTYLDRTPFEIGLGAGELINQVQKSPGWDWTEYPPPQVLLISPPPLGAKIDPLAAEIFVGGLEKSQQLPAIYAAIADAAGEYFFDAGSVVSTDGVDGIHFTAETNRMLGQALAEEVIAVLKQ